MKRVYQHPKHRWFPEPLDIELQTWLGTLPGTLISVFPWQGTIFAVTEVSAPVISAPHIPGDCPACVEQGRPTVEEKAR